MSLELAGEAKARGNAFFATAAYVDALEAYECGLEILLKDEMLQSEEKSRLLAVLRNNQSNCAFHLRRWSDSTEYARNSISYDPSFQKAFFRLAKSLEQEWKENQKYFLLKEAKLLLLQRIINSSTEGTSYKTIAPFIKLYRELEQKHFETFYINYFKIRKIESIEARYDSDGLKDSFWFKLLQKEANPVTSRPFFSPSGSKGKGIFARHSIEVGSLITTETPICQHLKTSCMGLKEACSHCMRHKITAEDFEKFGKKKIFMKISEAIYGDQSAFLACECGEIYCSIFCKKMAWNLYHQYTCGRQNQEGKDNYYSAARFHGATNPLVIARMFGMAIAKGEQDFPGSTCFVDFGPFEYFECDGEEGIEDEEFFTLLCKWIGVNAKAKGIRTEYVAHLFTLTNYKKFNAMIQRNAQELFPVSDLHHFLATCTGPLFHKVSNLLGWSTSDMENINLKMQEDSFLQSLCKSSASSMLQIGNCMNHSCKPNVIAACGHNDHRIQFIAIKPIPKGTELFRSYIDESLPFTERQGQLQKKYGFDCKCTGCR